MANIFSQKDTSKPELKRNNFDMSFQNNLTLRFGALYPVFTKECIPNDSFEIKPELLLRLMPTVFPVQSKIFVNMHFFFVPLRSLWNRYKDFRFNTKDGLIPPYIYQTDSNFFRTGSLSDYLGIPNVESADYENYMPAFVFGSLSADDNGSSSVITYGETSPDCFLRMYLTGEQVSVRSIFNVISNPRAGEDVFMLPNTIIDNLVTHPYRLSDALMTSYSYDFRNANSQFPVDWSSGNYSLLQVLPVNLNSKQGPLQFDPAGTYLFTSFWTGGFSDQTQEPFELCYLCGNDIRDLSLYSDVTDISQVHNGGLQCTYNQIDGQNFAQFEAWGYTNLSINNRIQTLCSEFRFVFPVIICYSYQPANHTHLFNRNLTASDTYVYDSLYDCLYVENLVNPFTRPLLPFVVNQNGDIPLPISALPYRCYEAIYNSFYRNQQNDPFLINGEPEYNTWIPNEDGGADDYNYSLHYRCYEPDCFTTAMPSPQQGIAPLVGVTGDGTFTFQDENTGTTYNLKPVIGADGNTLTGIEYYDSGLPVGTLQTMMHFISQGISINDFRNVNSFQRWLEKNLRKGYRYKDMIEGRFGTNVRYDELNMPVFIGGMSDVVNFNTVINTAEGADNSSLGSFAGLGTCYGNGRPITYHCDEDGFIMGILSISPIPAYDSVLPKFFLYNNPLDYFSPEFNKIGMQPILYSELSPIQRFKESLQGTSDKKLTDTFGYQRAWYNLVASLDEVHGDMRGNLSNYVLYRKFLNSPLLGREFLEIFPSDLTDVFADTDENDKIVGAINFSVTKKSIVPRYIIPGLE